ncbi:hypothetical protein PRIPAC_81673, partial [Pristionchus pacificus]|uniref:Uncharacterized protein n=1 Tax=Pristionchus pacificus TaxID=54126 RepID=A0A2A6CLP5_PRIPA
MARASPCYSVPKSMNGSLIFSIPNGYPIFPLAIGAANALAFLPIFWLLFIAQIAPLHNNCRYILVVWTLSYGVIFALNVVIALIDLTQPSGYMPASMFEPHLRFQVYQLHVMCTSFCATLEIALSIERRVAIIKPRAYHFSDMAGKTLVSGTVVLMAFSYFVDYCVHNANGRFVSVGCALMSTIELSVLATGALTTRACRRKYEDMYGKASMTARYQPCFRKICSTSKVNEAFEMSRAMMPTYVTSFKLKAGNFLMIIFTVTYDIQISAIISLFVYFAYMDRHADMLGYLEAHYFLVNAINGSYSMVLLLHKHPQLRKYTVRKIRNRIGAEPPPQPRRKSVKEDTEANLPGVIIMKESASVNGRGSRFAFSFSSMNGTRIFTVLNGYPVFPIAFSIPNLLALIPEASVIYIAQIAPLHNNCRYILCVWTTSYATVFLLNISIGILDSTTGSGYMPGNCLSLVYHRTHLVGAKLCSDLRFVFYKAHVSCTVFCSMCDIALSIERRIAIIKPRAYHFSEARWVILIPTTLALALNALLVFIGCVLLNVIEISVLVVSPFALSKTSCMTTTTTLKKTPLTRHTHLDQSSESYEQMYGKASLTARYQVFVSGKKGRILPRRVNEAYEMSHAMMPGYFLSFLLKASTIIFLCVFLAVKQRHSYLLGYLEAYYFLIDACNGSFSMIFLLSKHPQFKLRSGIATRGEGVSCNEQAKCRDSLQPVGCVLEIYGFADDSLIARQRIDVVVGRV